ncbi:MAG: DUF402 domain-containing protein [Acidimicrobiia bacterium]|nr:DUF402 domain-containing protein [Acidimicrobiia bacterium]
MDPIWLERRKWPDLPHYRHQAWPLGKDEFGTWFELKVGYPVYRGEELLFHGTSGGLMLLRPGDAPWMAWFPAHGRFELYVDIVTPPVVHDDGSITMVDLDFDVIRTLDGTVELVDEDEFVEHQVRYGYPPDIIEAALTASAQVFEAVQRGEPPFDGAAARAWAARIGITL